jgi:hypothetical protein
MCIRHVSATMHKWPPTADMAYPGPSGLAVAPMRDLRHARLSAAYRYQQSDDTCVLQATCGLNSAPLAPSTRGRARTAHGTNGGEWALPARTSPFSTSSATVLSLAHANDWTTYSALLFLLFFKYDIIY